MKRQAKAAVRPMRQSTQYNCMTASMTMCLQANGLPPEECSTEMVNAVMGARPMKGASWEQALACAQHYGMRGILMVPCTVKQLKTWTDQGVPVMIAWNPEGREWSHASVVFDVTESEAGLMVHVADPNIPNPDKTTRVMTEDEFYGKWFEKWPNYLVRRPGLAIMREITPEGRQVMASNKTAIHRDKIRELHDEYRQEQYLDSDRYQQKQERLRVEAQYLYIKWMLHDVILPGWGTQQDDPEVLAFVTRLVTRKRPVSVWDAKALLKKWKLSPKATGLILKLLKEVDGMDEKGDRNYVPLYYDNWGLIRANNRKLKELPPPIVKKWAPFAGRFKPYKGPVPGEGTLSTPVKPVMDSTEDEKLVILRTLADKVKDWPEGLTHVEKVIGDYESGRKLSPDDLKKIRNYLYKNRMRDEANHFRQAGVRVAVSWEHRQQMHDEYRQEQRNDRRRDKQWALEQARAEKKNADFKKARLHYHIAAELDRIRPLQQWLKKIERAHTSKFENLTLDPRLVKLPRGIKSPSWKVYVGKVTQEEFDELAVIKKRYPQIIGSDQNIEPYQERYAQKMFQEAGLDSSGKKIEDSGEDQKIQILETLADKVKGWPEGLALVEKVIAEYKGGKKPSPDDLKAIRNYLYKNRMRDEADHFRKAFQVMAQTPAQEDALQELGWSEAQIDQMSHRRIEMVLKKKIRSKGKRAKVDEKLMTRAALLFIYKGEKEAAKILMDDSISAEDAYLAVKAGAMMNHQPDKLINKVIQRYANRVTRRT